MRLTRTAYIGILLLFAIPSAHAAPATTIATNTQGLTQEARQRSQQYRKKLTKALQASILTRGPAATAKHYGNTTQQIDQQFSQQGWRIRRTSSKVRNPNNRPDLWEQRILQNFALMIGQGAPAERLEETAVIVLNGKKTFRYMKAITVTNACLSCHGTKVSRQVRLAIDDRYPNDPAKGYRKGDIIGAVSIYKALE
ncbi:hypothetical protein A9Q99_22355 [Gammaproteobacteria bacterium 45_16_T64]|nr:hypothetical protein A9Q99_22355 [Gammaproteobacteria bacterium 45_16_T64]